eukprot:TRINITY_DN10184_c0_g1_i4.p1 TRINITY_DN10184_c0_g1~~TRINITY_DN10184_c0_g1_i4.p1  ORF type:complete len:491 (+),score=118.53 TRINITY_DN10184_c0_g1_i4:185-1657(+)
MIVYDYTCSSAPHVPSTQDYYEGIFTRLMKRMPSLDWYWIWTPEAWEWGKMTSHDPVFTDAIDDLSAAMAAKDALGFKPKMATNGWVVGPLPDRSIFDQVLPSSWDAITSIDLNTGHSPVDPSYQNVTRHAKWAIPWMEDDPTLTQPQLWVNRTLEHMEDAAKYGCTGLLGIHWRTRATGPQISAMAQKSWKPGLTSQQFWVDWAAAQFGSDATQSAKIAALFQGVDSTLMPIVVVWAGGPGQMTPKCFDSSQFDFVDQLARLAPTSGLLNQARFDYWLSSFRYMRAIASTDCAWLESNTAMAAVAAGKSPTQQKQLAEILGLPARVRLVANLTVMMEQLQHTLSTPGELGTYMNIESHSLLQLLATDLEAYLGAPLPAEAMPPRVYSGEARLVVPTVRNTAERALPVSWRALVLGSGCSGVQVKVRALGSSGEFSTIQFRNVGRSVYELTAEAASLPDQDFEYYIEAVGGCGAMFPPGSPLVTQSVVWV